MIIECKNCLKKFTVSDGDIPIKGRTVQCGNCSTQWLQMPTATLVAVKSIKLSKKIDKEDQKPSENKFKASDGKLYKFLGNQWAELLPSGKFGKLARKKISKELNQLSGKPLIKKTKTIIESNQPANIYQETESGRMGIFSFLIVLIIFFAAIILLLDTFKNQLMPFFPDLANYLVYIFETLNNIYIIIKDLINNYK